MTKQGTNPMYRISVAVFVIGLLAAGCGGSMGGEYVPHVYVIEGREESSEPGYTRAAVEARLREEGRALVLDRDGTHTMRFGASGNEGRWRRDGNTLYLRDTVSQGNPIVPALQSDRAYTIRADGSIADEGTYSAYNLVVVYVRR